MKNLFCNVDLAARRSEFHSAQPFPHLILDNAIDESFLRLCFAEWPSRDELWTNYQRKKRAIHTPDMLGENLRRLLQIGNSKEVIQQLEALTGIADLRADEGFTGAGLHETHDGGALGIHVDFNKSGDLYRRLNMLLFLNSKWTSDWNGILELRKEPKRQADAVSVEPVWNRLILFVATERSWHGHPQPLTCPPGESRKSVAWYYYSSTPPPDFKAEHSTIYA